MSKKPKISQADMEIFQGAIKGTKPLLQKKIRLNYVQPQKKIAQPNTEEDDDINFLDSSSLNLVRGEEFIAFNRPGISHKILRKLRKGQYNVEAELDLHGKSIEEAQNALRTFFKQCLKEGIRVVLIIHGKGRHQSTPILKNKLNHWLREINIVLAFCSSAPTHGSRGALYVLLRNSSKES